MLEVLGIIFIALGLILILVSRILSKYNSNSPVIKRGLLDNFCVLIPARDESKVIEDLLISLTKQTKKVNMQNVFVIVESKDDPSIYIARKYDASYFIRRNLDLKTKGYALDEMIKELVSMNIYYDAYFILDADNVLSDSFMEKMEKSYMDGYDMAIGFRNMKNGNDSLIAATSGITFSLLNTNSNELKSKQSRNVTLSGTGMFIVGDLIKKWQSFPFHSLTEDYELTLYAIDNGLTSFYNKDAEFFDEQPARYDFTINQRMRWVKGYFTNRKEYLSRFDKSLKRNPNFGSVITEIIGMKPYILMIVGAVLYILSQIINIVKLTDVILSLRNIGIVLGVAYASFAIMTAVVIFKDKRIALNNKMKIKAIFFSPLFFITYVPCAIKAIFKKDITWEKVEHISKWGD